MHRVTCQIRWEFGRGFASFVLALSGAGLFLGNPDPVRGAGLSSPATPERERQSFALADASLAIDLAASEPEVVSPVAIAWDADGRLFVAEMTDYPTGPRSGRVRLLEDLNGDGRYEKATVFADSLPFPNSVLPWNGGVLVTAAPEILFLKDADGDESKIDKGDGAPWGPQVDHGSGGGVGEAFRVGQRVVARHGATAPG